MINTPWYSYGFGILDRTFGFFIQLALSLFVLTGIRIGRQRVLWFAVFLHALIDFPSALFQAHKLPPIQVEPIIAVIGGIAVWYIKKSKSLFSSNNALNDSIESN